MSTVPPTDLDVVDAMFRAIESGDFDAYRRTVSPDTTVWTNFDAREQTFDQVLATVTWLHGAVADLRYDIVRRETIPGGVVQQHVLRGTASGGTVLAMPATVWCTITDGVVSRMEEYLDPRGVKALFRPAG